MKRTVDVTRASRLNFASSLIRRNAIVQRGSSLTIIFGLICLGVIRFLCTVGTDGIHTGAPAIDKGRFSDNRSLHLIAEYAVICGALRLEEIAVVARPSR